jgi:DNA-binding transcriptional MerR regulator
METLVPSKEAALAVGVHPQTLRRWAAAGLIKPAMVMPSGRKRWDLADLRRQLAMKDPTNRGDAQ